MIYFRKKRRHFSRILFAFVFFLAFIAGFNEPSDLVLGLFFILSILFLFSWFQLLRSTRDQIVCHLSDSKLSFKSGLHFASDFTIDISEIIGVDFDEDSLNPDHDAANKVYYLLLEVKDFDKELQLLRDNMNERHVVSWSSMPTKGVNWESLQIKNFIKDNKLPLPIPETDPELSSLVAEIKRKVINYR